MLPSAVFMDSGLATLWRPGMTADRFLIEAALN
jgi:hypothetical protein